MERHFENMLIIHVGDLWNYIKKKILLIVIFAVLGGAMGAGYQYTRMDVVPMYSSTVKLYVTGVESAVPSGSAFSLGQSTMPNYVELMKSRPVLEGVIEKFNLNMSYSELLGCLSTSNISGTAMMTVTIVFPDPEWAKTIVDEVVLESSAYALDIMGMSPPTIYQESMVASYPYNQMGYGSLIKYGILGFAGLGAVACFLLLVRYFTCQRFKNPDVVVDSLHVDMLGVIPDKKVRIVYADGAMRHIYFRLLYDYKDKKTLSLSTITNTGASLTAVNQLASYLVKQDKKVLVLDSNVSHPEWGLKLEMPEGKMALSDYLECGAKLDELLFEKDDITYITAVPKADSGIQYNIAIGEKVAELMVELKNRFDYVLVVAAPVSYGPEGKVVSEMCDVRCLVLSAKRDKKYVVKQVLREQNQDTHFYMPDSVILTDALSKKCDKYFYKHFGGYFECFTGKKSKK